MTKAFIINSASITVYVNNQVYTVDQGNHMAADITKALKEGDWVTATKLVDMASNLRDYTKGKFQIEGGSVVFNGEVIDDSLTRRILDMQANGDDIEPMVNFVVNLQSNPSKRAIDELYGFLDSNSLPITDDGHFLAYKNVGDDYFDRHSHSFDNSVGRIPEMPRNKVDDDKDRTCSTGLHFCSMEYLKGFWGTSGHTMIIKVNPKDVVSIPVDYNNSKGRCCRYEVISEHKAASSKVEAFNQPVVYTQAEYEESYWEGYRHGTDDNGTY